MSLGAIYLWEPEIYTGQVPDLDHSERAAYDLYQQYRRSKGSGKALVAWAEVFATKVNDPKYEDYFSQDVADWTNDLSERLRNDPQAIIELEHFDVTAQGDALYRMFYEAVQSSGVGFYEPRFGVWGSDGRQSPSGAVAEVLSSFLLPLSLDAPTFDLHNIVPPRNLKKATELTTQWFAHHPYAKHLKLHVFNTDHDFINTRYNKDDPELAPDKGYREFILTDEIKGVFYQIKLFIDRLTTAPMVSCGLNLTDHFIPKYLQTSLSSKLVVFLDPSQIRINEEKRRLLFPLTSRWDSQMSINQFFKNFNGYLNFVLSYMGRGQLQALQAWAYGDMPEGVIVLLDDINELLIIALSLDHVYLQQRYEHHKQAILAQDQSLPGVISALNNLEEKYIFYQELMQIVKEAGTALPPYQRKINA